MKNERTRLVVGALLIAASFALGAGSERWLEEPRADAPLLEPVHATPPVALAQPAAGRASAPSIESRAAASVTTDAVKDRSLAPVAVPVDTIREEALLVLEGSASWYSDALAGRATASGEPYDPRELIAAHRALPFGTRLRVTNLSNDRSVEVRVIDRGPFIAGRIVDLSRSAAEQIGIVRAGHGRVRVEVLEYGG